MGRRGLDAAPYIVSFPSFKERIYRWRHQEEAWIMYDIANEAGYETQECLIMHPSHIDTVLSKAKLTHYITENSTNISIKRLLFPQASGNQ